MILLWKRNCNPLNSPHPPLRNICDGADDGAYFHPDFIRGDPDRCQLISRGKDRAHSAMKSGAGRSVVDLTSNDDSTSGQPPPSAARGKAKIDTSDDNDGNSDEFSCGPLDMALANTDV